MFYLYHAYAIRNIPYERFMLQSGKSANALGAGGRHGSHPVADAAGGAAVGVMAERHHDRVYAGIAQTIESESASLMASAM